MNLEKLKKLLDEYKNLLPELFSKENREYVKWSAALQFQKCWDTYATDFSAMFKQAVSKTDMLINNRMVQPTAGIIRLAERPELQETIRSAFQMLFDDDGGDLKNRQYRIEQFVLKINALLAEYESGKWKYKQDFRSALAYLNLYRPSQNYLLKSSQAYQFKYCVEYGDDFGYGSQFSLEKYYRMCDEIREAISADQELLETHAEYLKICPERIMDADQLHDDHHLLTFDVIYCTSVYNLYAIAGLSIIRQNDKSNRQVMNDQIKAEAFRQAIQECEMKLCELHGKRGQLEDFSVIGLPVSHSMFGRGTIILQDQMRIVIQFADKERIMLLPDAFTNTNLKTDDPQIPDIMQEICKLDRQIESVKREIRDNQHNLHKLCGK
ncbi:MAG: hypothetical protein IJM46_02220 [Oscillospiraceae bacterium]|nr:hypothetical protein [Oscillospiraceae bacterium]